MDISLIASILAGICFVISSILYVRDTASTKIKPSIATFGILSLVNFSQLISLISKDVWHVVPFTAVGLLQALAVFIIALRGKNFYFKFADKLALLGALAGFILWLVTKDAAYNIYIINAVTAITFVPLIIKAFKEPALETSLPWQTNLLASTFLLLTISSSSPVVWIVPVRQFLCSLLINIGLRNGRLDSTNKQRDQIAVKSN
jgi:hypothetical protein